MRNPGTETEQSSWQPAAVLVCLLVSFSAFSAEMSVEVLDRDGNAVPGVVVYAEGMIVRNVPVSDRTAVMDQIDTRFVPHILVVQEGTLVEFPNSDVIGHHVYSFSRPNDFMLPLYKGDAHAPVRFDDAGLVTLGCNIHDQMLAYVLVLDSDVFATTNKNGKAVLDISDAAEATFRIWSPRIRPADEELTLTARPAVDSTLTFRLTGRLRPAHESEPGGVKWTDY
jgi:plastocyanin